MSAYSHRSLWTQLKRPGKKSSDPSAPQEVLDNDDLLAPKTPPAGAYGNGAATPTSPHALDAATLQATFLLIPCQNGILF